MKTENKYIFLNKLTHLLHEAGKPIINSYLVFSNEDKSFANNPENKKLILNLIVKSRTKVISYKDEINNGIEAVDYAMKNKIEVLIDWYSKQYNKIEDYLLREKRVNKKQLLLAIKNMEEKNLEYSQDLMKNAKNQNVLETI